MQRKTKRNLFFAILILFVIGVFPAYFIGIYAHHSLDDYYYGAETAAVWVSTHSVFEVLRTAWEQMEQSYLTWQGNFSALFLMRLQPGIWGEDCYVIAPFLLLTSYIGGMFFFLYMAFRKIGKAGGYVAAVLALSLTFVSFEYTYMPSDSFYWFNGGIYYTFFHSLMLFLYGLMIFIYMKTSFRGESGYLDRILVWGIGILCIPLAFCIGGSNYGTALFSSIILVLLSIGCIVSHLSSKKRTVEGAMPSGAVCLLFALIAAACLAGLVISIAAPGNAVRQESVGGSSGLIKTFAYTFAYGGYSLANMLSAPNLVLFAALSPALYCLASKMRGTFRYPLPVCVFTFGLYCSIGTPVFYAQGLRIPYRLMNIIYFTAYIFVTFNLVYFYGYIHRRFGESSFIKEMEKAWDRFCESPKKIYAAAGVCMLLFVVASLGTISVTESESESGKAVFSNMPLSMSAVLSLADGEAKAYDEALTARHEYLSDTSEEKVVVAPLPCHPDPIFHSDITEDAGNWENSHLAEFYHKQEIRLEKADPE